MPVATVGSTLASSSTPVLPLAGVSGGSGPDGQKVEDDASSRPPQPSPAAVCSSAAQAALTELKLGG